MARVFLILFLLSGACSAASLQLQSSQEQVRLLELYTSEGCSSCPPADRWLRQLRQDPALWQTLVPVAFHVDYWNYLGWQDPFSQARFSQRQRQYARHGYAGSVYTPGFFLNGREWRGWFRPRILPSATEERAKPGNNAKFSKGGVLRVHWDGNTLKAGYSPHGTTTSADYQLHVVALGFDLQTQVPSGENQGKTLAHDFVALSWDRFPATTVGTSNVDKPDPEWRLNYAPTFRDGDGFKALIFWVTRGNDPEPLQAAGGWIQS
ncbi:MAG: DUF1223 domain-containing protein [Gammaproteobacteria bacterium]|nr:DUF1223 domain-containing protein [Gammaproteobacteria bacterium]MDH5801111.1 DUF1223 domain-containing protein [Gammaproteobacteria bacterium]